MQHKPCKGDHFSEFLLLGRLRHCLPIKNRYISQDEVSHIFHLKKQTCYHTEMIEDTYYCSHNNRTLPLHKISFTKNKNLEISFRKGGCLISTFWSVLWHFLSLCWITQLNLNWRGVKNKQK